MYRLLPFLIWMLISGCASPIEKQDYWNRQRAKWKLEQKRLNHLYRSNFERGFLAAWAGGGGPIETAGLIGTPTDPDGDLASLDGWNDGRQAGRKVRVAFEMEKANKLEK
jgi:hypothetical protein